VVSAGQAPPMYNQARRWLLLGQAFRPSVPQLRLAACEWLHCFWLAGRTRIPLW